MKAAGANVRHVGEALPYGSTDEVWLTEVGQSEYTRRVLSSATLASENNRVRTAARAASSALGSHDLSLLSSAARVFGR